MVMTGGPCCKIPVGVWAPNGDWDIMMTMVMKVKPILADILERTNGLCLLLGSIGVIEKQRAWLRKTFLVKEILRITGLF